MAILSNKELLKRLPIFSLLTESQVEYISSSLIKQRFRRGSLVLQKDRKNEYFYVMLNGTAQASITNDNGNEVILFDLQSGDYFGEHSLLDGAPSEFSVRVRTQADVLMLSRSLFLDCISHNPNMIKSLLLNTVSRLRETNARIESMALYPVHIRAHRELARLAKLSSSEGNVIFGKLSRQDLARRVGASREMVSRVLKDFEERCLIRTEPDNTKVHLTTLFWQEAI